MVENKKSMPIWLIIILTILGTCLVGFGVWYGIKHIKGEETIEETSSKIEISIDENSFIKNDELSLELSKIHKFVYDYFLSWPYCGESEKVDGNDLLRVSKQFKTYNELSNYLKGYMSEDLIYQNKESYYEENGKLYCKMDAKGWVYEYQSNKVNIVNLTDVKAETKVTVTSVDPENSEYVEEFDVTFEKVNGNWVITKYEEIK